VSSRAALAGLSALVDLTALAGLAGLAGFADLAALVDLAGLTWPRALALLSAFAVLALLAALVAFALRVALAALPVWLALAVLEALFVPPPPLETEGFLDGVELLFFPDERSDFLAPTATSLKGRGVSLHGARVPAAKRSPDQNPRRLRRAEGPRPRNSNT
jgi:hypothetical protein